VAEVERDVAPLIQAMARWQDAQRAAERAADVAALHRRRSRSPPDGHRRQAAADAAREALAAAQVAVERAAGAAEEAPEIHVTAARHSASATADVATSRAAEHPQGSGSSTSRAMATDVRSGDAAAFVPFILPAPPCRSNARAPAPAPR
jgi:hypothetical protein